jgi:Guanylate-binding protein, N-terminal domain
VVQPVADHTKLELSNEGLSVLRNIKGKVAPVVVIGPYRSGKSFTLNQLLGVGCDEGFGVGHTRNTQTKGVWMWGEPIPVQSPTGETINILLFDTEGFESTGKADSYDDRIFALSTLISSVLIYNLPESIRESDVEKLSFAAELAKAFYTTSTSNENNNNDDGNNEEGGVQDTPIRPGSMVWLIQRDFLQGATLKKTLETALKQVPNPHKDPAITQLNRIRQGLAAITGNSTALGLPQPHLDRTRLCEIPDGELDPNYLQKREELKTAVMTSALPKVVKGQALDGSALADLISQVVTALNDRDIPTAGSLVEYFNRELVESCRAQFVKSLEKIAIPVEETTLQSAAEIARKAASAKFEKERFGSAVESLREILDVALKRELSSRQTSNTYESSRVCEAAELECETALEREAAQKLPSTGRFEARYQKCKASFDQQCVGPAKVHNEERLQKAWERESSRFNRDYNERLYNGLVLMAVAAIVIFRFVVRWSLGETAGWAAFLFLQLYPKSFLGTGSSMYETATWQSLVGVWEIVIDNPLIDLERWGTVSLVVVMVLVLTRRRWAGKCKDCCGRRRGGGGRGRSKTLANRDLDV